MQSVSRILLVNSSKDINVIKRFNSTTDYVTNFWTQSKPGKIYDKKPARLILEEGKKYDWCLCGKSNNQPFCDGSHVKTFFQFRPVSFTVPETKEYALCMCKQTKKRPFCDGTHKQDFVQNAVPDFTPPEPKMP